MPPDPGCWPEPPPESRRLRRPAFFNSALHDLTFPSRTGWGGGALSRGLTPRASPTPRPPTAAPAALSRPPRGEESERNPRRPAPRPPGSRDWTGSGEGGTPRRPGSGDWIESAKVPPPLGTGAGPGLRSARAGPRLPRASAAPGWTLARGPGKGADGARRTAPTRRGGGELRAAGGARRPGPGRGGLGPRAAPAQVPNWGRRGKRRLGPVFAQLVKDAVPRLPASPGPSSARQRLLPFPVRPSLKPQSKKLHQRLLREC